MKCKECGNLMKVLDTYYNKDRSEIYRKRRCVNCGKEIYTYERCPKSNEVFVEKIWKKNSRYSKMNHDRYTM